MFLYASISEILIEKDKLTVEILLGFFLISISSWGGLFFILAIKSIDRIIVLKSKMSKPLKKWLNTTIYTPNTGGANHFTTNKK
jgi:hypothetical protein